MFKETFTKIKKISSILEINTVTKKIKNATIKKYLEDKYQKFEVDKKSDLEARIVDLVIAFDASEYIQKVNNAIQSDNKYKKWLIEKLDKKLIYNGLQDKIIKPEEIYKKIYKWGKQ